MDGSPDATNFLLSVHDRDPAQLAIVKFVHGCPNHVCHQLLVSYFKKLTSLAAEEFPQSASQVGKRELDFLSKNRLVQRGIVAKWNSEYSTVGLNGKPPLTQVSFGRVGLFLCQCIYFLWSRLLVDEQRPPIEIPSNVLVGQFARPLVYYVAGWTLQRASLALTVKESERDVYKMFAVSQKISQKESKTAGLPCALVELRQKKKLYYASEAYFGFILF